MNSLKILLSIGLTFLSATSCKAATHTCDAANYAVTDLGKIGVPSLNESERGKLNTVLRRLAPSKRRLVRFAYAHGSWCDGSPGTLVFYLPTPKRNGAVQILNGNVFYNERDNALFGVSP